MGLILRLFSWQIFNLGNRVWLRINVGELNKKDDSFTIETTNCENLSRGENIGG